MRKLKLLGLAAVALLALSAYAASSAFAVESTWLVSGAVSGVQHAVDSESTAAGFSLADAKGGIFGEEVEILCIGTDLGFVGPGKEDLLETITVTSCETMKGICSEPLAVPINLPWLTTIELIGGVFYDDIVTEATGKTTVGYTVTCSGTVEDTCETTLGRALLENVAGGTVNAVFSSADANQPKANCSRGGAGAGLVNGTDVILSETGLTIAVSEG